MKNKYGILNTGIGVISGLVGIYTASVHVRNIAMSLLITLATAVVLGSLFEVYRRKIATVVGDLKFVGYNIRQTNPNNLTEIANLQRAFYPNDAVPLELYKEWYRANPDGFFVVELNDESKELVGHFTLLAIKKERLELYKDGDILETDIRGCDLLSSSNKDDIEEIYVESVIIKKIHRRYALPGLIRILPSMIDLFASKRVKTIYAMAATGDGEKILKDFSFVEVPTRRTERKDKHTMYSCEFSDFLHQLVEKGKRFESKLLKKGV